MKLAKIWQRYDRAIWVRAIGTVLTTVTSFAIRPFLAVYLYSKTASVYYIGIILGLAPLMGVFTNLWGGSLADKNGRKPLMVYSLMLQGVSMLGYVFAQTPLHFALVSVLNGAASSLYFPAANAQITDIVPEHQRSEVFAFMHTALNVGAAVGPMLGLLMVKINQNLAFICSSASLFVYGFLVLLLVPETWHAPTMTGSNAQTLRRGADKEEDAVPKKRGWQKIEEHLLLVSFTLLAMPITLLYAQVESNFPLYLKANFDNYLSIFTTLMTLNGTIVVLSAVWLAKKTEKLYLPNVLVVSYVLFALVGVGYGFGPWAKTIPLLFVAEVIFTVGEGITFPNQNKLISLIAPEEMRGRYFSVFSLNWGISKSIGPLLGAAVFAHFGGLALFLSISSLLLVAGILVYKLTKAFVPATRSHKAEV